MAPIHNPISSSSVLQNLALTSSTSLTNSTTSGRTIVGPGALSGKAILALGKLTLRGAEFIIIRRRLHLIATKFPIADAESFESIEEMYDDLLELSRPNLYTKNIRDRALQILLVQISKRQTRYMVRSLCKWPDIEVHIFLLGLTTLLDPIRISLPGVRDEANIRTYWTALPPWESHSLVPFIEFLALLVKTSDLSENPRSFHVVIVDFLLHLYATNFHDPLAKTDCDVIHRTSILYAVCVYLLESLCDIKSGVRLILKHHLGALWPTRPQLPMNIPLGLDRIAQRLNSWNSISQQIVYLRLRTMSDMMMDYTRSIDESVMHDICTDSTELVASQTMNMEIRIQALKLLYLFVWRGDLAAQSIIREQLLMQTREHNVRLFSRIIQILARMLSEKTPECNLFYSDWDLGDLISDPSPHFKLLRLFMNLARNDEALLIIILAADILGLMRPFLEVELRGDPERQIAFHSDDMLTVYDSQDYSLLQLIKKHGLKTILRPVPPGDAYRLRNHRRIALCQAFDVFLGREKTIHFATPDIDKGEMPSTD